MDSGGRPTSWIITMPNGVVFEAFKPDTADKARAAGWTVETALEYLGRINREIKAKS